MSSDVNPTQITSSSDVDPPMPVTKNDNLLTQQQDNQHHGDTLPPVLSPQLTVHGKLLNVNNLARDAG